MAAWTVLISTKNAEVDGPHSGSEAETRRVEGGRARGFIYAPSL